MPAVSKKQQRFFGIVRAAQKGSLKGEATPSVQRAAASMKIKDVKKFASTKHKGLPEKKVTKESTFAGNYTGPLYARWSDVEKGRNKPIGNEEQETQLENKSGDNSLRDWFGKSRSSDGKPGWVQLGGKYAGKPCAKQPGQTTKPKCGSSKMKRDLNKDEEERAFRRKNRKDPNPNRSGKAINVKTEATYPQDFRNADGSKRAVAKKKTGKPNAQGDYGKKDLNEGEKDACYHKVKSRYKVWPSAYASGALVKCRKKGAKNWGNSTKKEEFNGKPFQAFQEEAKKCWKGYEKKGTQKLFGKTYNRCVKKEETTNESAAWTKKSGKNESGGLNEKGRKSYERENPGSDLKAPSKKVGNPRRASFCARMKGMKKKLTSKKTASDPDSRINKSLRAWNC